MRSLRLTDDPELTRQLASGVLAERLGQPSVALRIEFGGRVQKAYFGFAVWDGEHNCYLIRLKTQDCTWHDLAHEIAHCVHHVKPGHSYDRERDPREEMQKEIDVDRARGEEMKFKHIQEELLAGYDADDILEELRELAERRGYDLCDHPSTASEDRKTAT